MYPISNSVYIRNESDSFTIECISFGVPLPTIYWLPGPLNVTRDIGNGDQFLTRGEVSPFMAAINGQAIRLLNLSDQCPMDDGPLVCRDAVDYGNNTGTGCNGLNGSLCPVSCGVVINSYNDTDNMDRPVTVSRLTLCSLLKTEELSYTCLAVNNVTNDLGTPQGVSTNLIVQGKKFLPLSLSLNGVGIFLDKCPSSLTESQTFVLNYNVNFVGMTVWLGDYHEKLGNLSFSCFNLLND